MNFCYSIVFYLVLIIPKTSAAQITEKDFKLCIDNIGCSDSTLKISKQQLLNAKKVTPNFPWLTIKSLIISIGEGNYTSEMLVTLVKGDTINEEVLNKFKLIQTGGLVTIEVEGYNKNNGRIPWASMFLRIIQ